MAHALQPSCPPLDHSLQLREAIGQSCRARLQDQRRFDFIHSLVLHGRSSIEARPRRNVLGPELFPAPGADDQIGLPRDYLLGRHNTALGCALISKIGEDVDAAGDLDELRDPTNTGDQRIGHSSKNTLGRFFKLSARFRASARRASRAPTSSSARLLASTNAPSIRIISRIPATLRWLNERTAKPRRMRSAAMSAWRSENVRTRSGTSAMILSMFAEVKALTRGFSRRARGGRTT